MLNKEQLAQCKQRLLERQHTLIKQLEDHFGRDFEMIKESMGELSNYDNHPADHGTELFERGKDTALNEHAEKELEEINAALHAIEEGSYGICTKCGEDIPYERLIAMPETDRCVKHAKDNTFDHPRPIEEEVFSPNINPDEVTDEEQVGYDAEDAWQEVSRYGTSETTADFFDDKYDYDDMYPNSDENVGFVEEYENFAAADLHGKSMGATYHHKKFEKDDDEVEEF